MCFKRKKKLRGNIYLINDALVSDDGYNKANRRVVAINNNPYNLRIIKIKGLYDKNGNRRKKLIPIGKYKCLTKKSGISPRVYKNTSKGQRINERKLKKTNCRLRLIDRFKIRKIK